MQEGKAGFSAGTEVTAETEMDPGENTVPDIPPHILAAQPYDFRAVSSGAVCKQGDYGAGGKLHEQNNNGAEADRHKSRVPKRKPCTFRFARADVLGAQGRNSRQHGRGNQEQKADDLFHDPNCRCISKPPGGWQ